MGQNTLLEGCQGAGASRIASIGRAALPEGWEGSVVVRRPSQRAEGFETPSWRSGSGREVLPGGLRVGGTLFRRTGWGPEAPRSAKRGREALSEVQ